MTQQLRDLILANSANGYLIQDYTDYGVPLKPIYYDLEGDEDLDFAMHCINPLTVETAHGTMTVSYASDVRNDGWNCYYKVLF